MIPTQVVGTALRNLTIAIRSTLKVVLMRRPIQQARYGCVYCSIYRSICACTSFNASSSSQSRSYPYARLSIPSRTTVGSQSTRMQAVHKDENARSLSLTCVFSVSGSSASIAHPSGRQTCKQMIEPTETETHPEFCFPDRAHQHKRI